MTLKSQRELDVIRGKILVNAANTDELHDFLKYVSALESALDEASFEDFFGTEGWQHWIGVE